MQSNTGKPDVAEALRLKSFPESEGEIIPPSSNTCLCRRYVLITKTVVHAGDTEGSMYRGCTVKSKQLVRVVGMLKST